MYLGSVDRHIFNILEWMVALRFIKIELDSSFPFPVYICPISRFSVAFQQIISVTFWLILVFTKIVVHSQNDDQQLPGLNRQIRV